MGERKGGGRGERKGGRGRREGKIGEEQIGEAKIEDRIAFGTGTENILELDLLSTAWGRG